MGAVNQNAIAGATRAMEPFPHIVVDGVFTDAFYAELLEARPPAATFGAEGFGQLELSTLRHIPALARLTDAWEQEIAPAVLSRFVDLYDYKLALLFGDDPRRALQQTDTFGPLPIFMQRRMAGDSQNPHVDNAQSLFTCVMYLCDESADPRDGTTLYAADRDRLISAYKARREIRAWYPSLDEFSGVPHATMDYRPNRMLAFFSCPYSVHSVKIEHNPIRYSVQAQALVPQRVRDGLFAEWTDAQRRAAQG
jgi:hypothetical protein